MKSWRMKYNSWGLLAAAIPLLMLIGSAWTCAAIPSDALIPIHFGLDGKPDRWASPEVGLLLLPAIAIATAAVGHLTSRKQDAAQAFASRMVVLATMATMGGAHALILATVHGRVIEVPRVMAVMLACLFVLLPSALGGVEPNRWVGLRTPWTLADPVVWRRTHRAATPIFIGAGLSLFACAAFMTGPRELGIALLAATVVACAAPLILSYAYARAQGGAGR